MFYLADPKKGGSLCIVERIKNKKFYGVPPVLNEMLMKEKIFERKHKMLN